MQKNLVFVGAGHAHLTAVSKAGTFVAQGHRVTVISASAYHYYSGMGPGMLSGIYRPQEVRFHVKRLAESRGTRFIEAKVIGIDPGKKVLSLRTGEEVEYDVVSFNTGSRVPTDLRPSPQENVFPVKPIENLLKGREAVLRAVASGSPRLAVVGGGAAGVEITGNLWRLVADAEGKAEIALIAGGRLLGRFPEGVRERALLSLRRRGVEIIEDARVDRIGGACDKFGESKALLGQGGVSEALLKQGEIRLVDGRSFPYDVAFLAVGVRPSPLFRDSGLPTGKDGGLKVNEYLQSVEFPDVFGGGDCISFAPRPLAKVGVYAVRENPVLYHNLRAALEGGVLRAFLPQESYLLILNMGDGRGILQKKSWIWDGRLAFWIKNYIDRSFMKKFQRMGELEEP
jgi:NADH dehydrogenase FAD-containing subunit